MDRQMDRQMMDRQIDMAGSKNMVEGLDRMFQACLETTAFFCLDVC